MELIRTKIVFLVLTAVFVVVICIAVPIVSSNSGGGSTNNSTINDGEGTNNDTERCAVGESKFTFACNNVVPAPWKGMRSTPPVYVVLYQIGKCTFCALGMAHFCYTTQATGRKASGG